MATPEITIDGTRYLTTKQAAKQVGLSHDYVARLAREGKVVAWREKRSWYLDPVSLERFLVTSRIEKDVRARVIKSERYAEQTLHQDIQAIAATAVTSTRALSAQLQAAAVVAVALVMGFGHVGQSDESVVATVLQSTYSSAVAFVSEEHDSVEDASASVGSETVATELATGETAESSASDEAIESLLVEDWSLINARDLGAVWEPYFDPLRTYVRSWFAEPVVVVWEQPETPAAGLLLPTTAQQPTRPVAFIAESDRDRPERDE